MMKSIILVFCLMVGLAASGQNDIDYQNKRLIGNLKKTAFPILRSSMKSKSIKNHCPISKVNISVLKAEAVGAWSNIFMLGV